MTSYMNPLRRPARCILLLGSGLLATACSKGPPNVVYYVKSTVAIEHVNTLAVTLELLATGAPDTAPPVDLDRFSVPNPPGDFKLSAMDQKSFFIEFTRHVDGRLRTTISAIKNGLPVLFARDVRVFDFDAIDVNIVLDPMKPSGGVPDGGAPGGMVMVPEGAFVMGCTGPGCMPDESPQHLVMVSAFQIDQTEVTQADYQECVVAPGKPCSPPASEFTPVTKPDFPVVQVTWDQARAYCVYRGGRLPTEAEWEKASRGSAGATFPWGEAAPDCTLANFMDCPLPREAAPVGSDRTLGASGYGALDMAGNVWEWVNDWYSPTYYTGRPSPDMDPKGPATGTQRGQRGGSFLDPSSSMRSAERDSDEPTLHYNNVGFRCAK